MELDGFEQDVILKKANIHHGDIQTDKQFNCKNNCPFCNDEMIHIKLQYVLPMDDDIQFAEICKKFTCQLCGNEFWEVWPAPQDNYYFPDDSGEYFNEYDDYTDAYYSDRQDAFCESLEEAIKTGDVELVGSYWYTVIVPPIDEKEYASELSEKHKYPTYRRTI